MKLIKLSKTGETMYFSTMANAAKCVGVTHAAVRLSLKLGCLCKGFKVSETDDPNIMNGDIDSGLNANK